MSQSSTIATRRNLNYRLAPIFQPEIEISDQLFRETSDHPHPNKSNAKSAK